MDVTIPALEPRPPRGLDPAAGIVPVPRGTTYARNYEHTMWIPMPRAGFYTHMPPDSRCIFSDKSKKFVMQHPLPPRALTRWPTRRIDKEALRIDLAYHSEVRTMERPTEWVDLFNFFDAQDLWAHGAWNLWLVVHSLFQKAEGERHQAVFVWSWAWLTTEDNRNRLSRWQPATDILDVMGASDWLEGGILETDANARRLLREELRKWHEVYGPAPAAQGQTVQNWAGE